jgi:hypothetical protein
MKTINTLKMAGLECKLISRFHYQSIIEPHVDAQPDVLTRARGSQPGAHDSPQWILDAERWLRKEIEEKLARNITPRVGLTGSSLGIPRKPCFDSISWTPGMLPLRPSEYYLVLASESIEGIYLV